MVQLQMFKDYQAPSTVPTAETVRERLEETLSVLRNADKLPWSNKELHHWRIVFPQMANWLSPPDRAAVIAVFDAELIRLGASVKAA